jgi:hypothetical protein
MNYQFRNYLEEDSDKLLIVDIPVAVDIGFVNKFLKQQSLIIQQKDNCGQDMESETEPELILQSTMIHTMQYIINALYMQRSIRATHLMYE